MSALMGEADMPRPPGPYQTDANDPQRSLTRSRFAAVEKCLAFVSADACQSNAFPGSLSRIADLISRAAEPNIPQHPIVEVRTTPRQSRRNA